MNIYRPNFESEAGYVPNLSDLACQDALRLKGEAERSLKEIDPFLWACGKIAELDGRFAGQISDQEFLQYFTEKGCRLWDSETADKIRKLIDEAGVYDTYNLSADGSGFVG
jgi:hypothetical protein